MKTTLSFTILLGLWLAFPLQGRSQTLYEVDTLYPVHNLEPHALILQDSSNLFTARDILQMPEVAFKRRNEFGRFLAPQGVYWARLNLKTNAPLEGWVLYLDDLLKNNIAWIRSNGKVDVYAYQAEKLLFHKQSGAEYPASQRDLGEHWILNKVKLPLPVGKEVQLLVRIEGNSFGFWPNFGLSLRAPDFQAAHNLYPKWSVFHWFMLGVVFIVFVYHVLQYFYQRQAIYFWFSLWVLFCLIAEFMAVGLGGQVLFPEFPQLRLPLWLILPNSMLFAYWLFGRAFIRSKERFTRLDKVILAIPALSVISIVIHLLLFFSNPKRVVFTQIGFNYEFGFLLSIFSLGLAIYITTRKDAFARYFGVGAILASLGILLGSLWSLRWVTIGFDPYTVGMLVQVVAFSFGIAYRNGRLGKQAQLEHIEAERNKAEVLRIKDLDEIKTKFFTNLSHEFRTPLSLILGPLKGLSGNTKLSSNSNSTLEVPAKTLYLIQNNAERLQNLVDQLLELAQLESSKVHLNLRKGHIVGTLQQQVYSFESFAERKAVSLNASFPEELPKAYYDKDKLEKIISNLLTNAIKYTPRGGAVTVGIQYDENNLRIEVSDTGEGIKQENIKKIFERFYRVEGTEAQGSGIGLALVKELVDLHNGHITVKSEIGKGTDFRVLLPYTLSALPQGLVNEKQNNRENEIVLQAEVSNTEALEKLPISPLSAEDRPTVLIIEDNEDLRGYIADSIQHKYEVILAEDGKQGERLALEHLPDIVISDVMMPRMDGYALCHSLKTNAKTSHIPVLLLTAKVTHQDKLEGLNQGADAYLAKPFDTAELLIRLNNLAEGRRRLWEYFKSKDHLLIDDLEITSLDDKFMQDFFSFVKQNIDNEELSVEAIGKAVGFSRSQLHRKLKALTGKSATQLVMEMRLNEAHAMLLKRAGSVSEVAYSVGYSNLSYFTRSFKEKFGVLPSKV